MPIPESTLSGWSHHRSAKASKQAHVSIRKALIAHNRPSEVGYEVFLKDSYKNGTNLRRDSDVDVVVRLAHKLKHGVAALSGAKVTWEGRPDALRTDGPVTVYYIREGEPNEADDLQVRLYMYFPAQV